MIPGNIVEKALDRFGDEMGRCPQNLVYHGEGDVLTHTRMALDALRGMDSWKALDGRMRLVTEAAVALHDIGKTRTTVLENGVPVSPRHAVSSARMARGFMWKELGMCGDTESMMFREAVCWLVRHHSFPLVAAYRDDASISIQRMAANSALSPLFSVSALCMLARADAEGRKSRDTSGLFERIEFCEELASEEGCLSSPYRFPDSRTRRAYLSGRGVWKDGVFYDETWGEVVMVCGLPGTGKDTWIAENLPDMPMVSLDVIRKETGISPAENQGWVANSAREKARCHLRSHTPFVWNATNITRRMRDSLTGLFESYGARVRMVYLETGWDRLAEKNRSRECAVPMPAIESMLWKTQPPEAMEADDVEWICVK